MGRRSSGVAGVAGVQEFRSFGVAGVQNELVLSETYPFGAVDDRK
jgi:hypothetical protein